MAQPFGFSGGMQCCYAYGTTTTCRETYIEMVSWRTYHSMTESEEEPTVAAKQCGPSSSAKREWSHAHVTSFGAQKLRCIECMRNQRDDWK